MYDLRGYMQRQLASIDLNKGPTSVTFFSEPTSSEFGEIIFNRTKKFELKEKKKMENPLVNIENYGPYADYALGKTLVINAWEITKDSWDMHYESILNILKDGIHSDFVHQSKLRVIFGYPEYGVSLTVMDYFFNLIMWRPIILLDEKVQPCNVFFEKEIRARSIKDYIDNFVIEKNRTTVPSQYLSKDCISDTLYFYHHIDQFSNYLCNTLNLEDTADLMDKDPEFRQSMTQSYAGMQVDQVKDAIMKNAKISIECIKRAKEKLGRDHCLVDAWRANEGINPKQYAEFCIAIGIKPDGRGGIFPEIVDTSFIGGGISDPVNYFIESSTSRIAQIEKHKHVSESGTLARIMGLNSMDTYLHPDPNYDCHTPNLIPTEIKSLEHLKFLNLRWYREHPYGQEKCINYKKDKHLIGKTILIRSPITCASAARGNGVCYKCYGNLAYSVCDVQTGTSINIGRLASEFITSKQTQKQLSAKHILEASVDKIVWTPEFYNIFEMDNTVIQMSSEVENPGDYKMLINQDAIESDSDYDDVSGEDDDGEARYGESDEYITEFYVVHKPTGEAWHITTESGEKLYITNELNGIIRKKAVPTDDKISIPMSSLKEAPLFFLKVQNNELSKILNKLKNLFNRSNEVRGQTIPNLLQEILDTNIEGDMGISAIHYETILSNQIRDPDDVLERPDWSTINPPYRILTLDEALTKNPSVTISLSYQKITKAFYDPLTYKKNGASFMDLFFMKKPQLVIRDITEMDTEPKREPGQFYEPFSMIEDADKITVEDPSYVDDGELLDIEE